MHQLLFISLNVAFVSDRPFSVCTCWQHFEDAVCTSMSGRRVCMCVCVVCLPLLLWVSNASWLWYLWATIFEWCLLTVMVRPKLQTEGVIQPRCACVWACVCAHMLDTDITAWFSMIQAADWKAGGPRVILTLQGIVCARMCACMTVCVCGRVINSALKSHWHFSPSNLRHNNIQPWSIWHFTAVRGETSAPDFTDWCVHLSATSCSLSPFQPFSSHFAEACSKRIMM